jgi:Dolichyl-phosphate-mannose-protein mannosyltransferase
MSTTLRQPIETEPRGVSRTINFLQLLRRSKAELAISIIIGVFLFVNFWNIQDYGMSYDEPLGLLRGQDANEIISHVFRGTDYHNPRWEFQNHPSFYAFLDYRVAMTLIQRSVPRVPAVHALNIITGSAGLIVLFLFARRLFNSRIACFAVLVLSLNPRFIANVHYNGKDIPVMVFSTLTLYFLYRALTEGRKLYWILGGIAFGMSIDTKLDALIVLPVIITPVVVAVSLKQTRVSATSGAVILFGYMSLLSVYLFWPLLWLEPLHPINALRFWGGHFTDVHIMYLGQYIAANQAPWHYMPLHLLATTPVILIILGILGAVILFRNCQKQFEIVLLAAWIFWPLLPRLFGLMPQYGGMRQVYVLVPALAVISAVGFDFCFSWITTKDRSWATGLAFCCAIAAWLLVQCRQTHPYEGSYLNELTRFVLPRDKLANYFDFFSWCTPLKDGIDWLNQNAAKGAVVKVLKKEWLIRLLGSYPLRNDIRLVESGPADFAMELSELQGGHTENSIPVFAVKCYDTALLRIFRSTGDAQ